MLLLAPGGAHPLARAGLRLQSDYWFSPELAPYRALVDAYRDGRAQEAIDGVLAFDPEVIHALVDRIREPDARLTGTDRDPALNEQMFRAAAMLHVDVADAVWSTGREEAATDQIEVAVRWADLGGRTPEPQGSFRRRWYLGVGLLAFERGGWRSALSFVDLACEALTDDVALLTTAAWLNEQLALAPSTLGNTGASGLRELQQAKRARLQAAARRAGAAVSVTPAATEAALRLAHARLLLEEVEAARELLQELVGRTDLPTPHAYLARLMLGRLFVQTDERRRAERLFHEANELNPEGQAARVALAQLLDTQGDRRGAAAMLAPVLNAEQGGVIDPWVDYLLGVGGGPDLRDTLRAGVQR
jgi:tetratricopeptide (TPR) repeat protein